MKHGPNQPNNLFNFGVGHIEVGGDETPPLSAEFDESRSICVSRVQFTAGLREEGQNRGFLSQPVVTGNEIRNVIVDGTASDLS